jgi:hypothetical protein
MSKIKELLNEDVNSCEHNINIYTCIDCLYAMQTSHLPENYTPTIDVWYNKKQKRITRKGK